MGRVSLCVLHIFILFKKSVLEKHHHMLALFLDFRFTIVPTKKTNSSIMKF